MPSIGIQPRVTYPLEGTGFGGPLYTGTDDPIRIATNGIDSSLLMTLTPDPAGTYAFPASIEVNSKGQVTLVTAGTTPGAPTKAEELNQTLTAGTGLAVTGITSTSTAIVIVSNAVLQSDQYTLGAGSITFSDDLDDDHVTVYFWN